MRQTHDFKRTVHEAGFVDIKGDSHPAFTRPALLPREQNRLNTLAENLDPLRTFVVDRKVLVSKHGKNVPRTLKTIRFEIQALNGAEAARIADFEKRVIECDKGHHGGINGSSSASCGVGCGGSRDA